MSHTPTPLKLSLNEANWASHIVDTDGETVCSCEGTMPQAEQRAAHIVHCVNVHDQLVSALRMVESCFAPEDNDITAQTVRQALAAAEKGA